MRAINRSCATAISPSWPPLPPSSRKAVSGAQQRAWLWNMVEQEIIQSLRTSPEVRQVAERVEADLAAERVSAVEGATDILDAFARTFHAPASHTPASH